MRSSRARLVGLLFSILCISNVAAAERAEGLNDQDNGPYAEQQLEVADGVVLAGLVDLERLADTNSRVLIVDLRTAAEGTAAEAAQAESLGLRYQNVPIAGAIVDPARLDDLEAAIEAREAGELLVIHCASGNRAGMMWGALAVRGGADLASLKATLAPVLNKPPAIGALEEFAAAEADELR